MFPLLSFLFPSFLLPLPSTTHTIVVGVVGVVVGGGGGDVGGDDVVEA